MRKRRLDYEWIEEAPPNHACYGDIYVDIDSNTEGPFDCENDAEWELRLTVIVTGQVQRDYYCGECAKKIKDEQSGGN